MSRLKTTYILSLAIRVVVAYYKPTVIQNYTMVNQMSLTNPNTQCMIELCEPKTQEEIFEKTLIEAIDEVFSVFGQFGKEAVYSHLKRAYKIQVNDIPHKIEHFSDALHQSFGSGAKIIETSIIKVLYEKNKNFTYSPKKRDILFNEYAESLKCFLSQQTR